MASHTKVLDLLAEAATHEIEFLRLGRLLDGAVSQWGIEKDLYAGVVETFSDRESRAGAEAAFANSCFVLAELLERIGPRYEQAFDLTATHYELAVREQRQLDPAGLDQITTLIASFRTLPSRLLTAADNAAASADTSGTLAVTAALYPPNPDLQAALLRVESLQRQMIALYRSIRERCGRLTGTIEGM